MQRSRCLVLLLLVLMLGGAARASSAQAANAAKADSARSQPAPDTLVFTNGDRLTGKLVSASGGNVVFKSDMAGPLTIPFARVKELHSGSEFVALQRRRTAGRSRKARARSPLRKTR